MERTSLLNVADPAVVFCQGPMTSKEDVNALWAEINTKFPEVNVVLDFSKVKSLGPEALVALVALWHRPEQKAPRLAINPSLAFSRELRIRSLCRIDAELVRLLPQAEAIRLQRRSARVRFRGLHLVHSGAAGRA